jgi:copper resistance protein D
VLPEITSAVARILSFVALFQATGAAIFLAMFGESVVRAKARIQQIGSIAAFLAIALVLTHYLLEAALMAGELAGITDASLQRMVLESPTGRMLGLRLVGLLLIALSIRSTRRFSEVVALAGAAVTLASFVVIGHTSIHPDRPMLALLLLAHLFALAFWFGGLLPLYTMSAREPLRVASEVIDAFSAIALWLVPGLLIVGLLMATLLMPSLAVLDEPYGRLLTAKGMGYALLMLLATANKWRFAPAIQRGEAPAVRAFQRSVVIEFALIVVVLGITAVMTGFFSPDDYTR